VPETAPEEVADPVLTLRANIEAPGHAIGDEIKTGEADPTKAGLFQCGIDKLGRIWRVDVRDDGEYLVLAGRLAT
jgi:hypothetical protein